MFHIVECVVNQIQHFYHSLWITLGSPYQRRINKFNWISSVSVMKPILRSTIRTLKVSLICIDSANEIPSNKWVFYCHNKKYDVTIHPVKFTVTWQSVSGCLLQWNQCLNQRSSMTKRDCTIKLINIELPIHKWLPILRMGQVLLLFWS